ncbi:GPI ethanolamine phosphate transferase 2-like protein, partial [Euroglyphus maynei]
MKTNGIGLISVATIPTVTLPRIKALITGTLPSFMDYFLNLNPMVMKNNDVEKNKLKKQRDDNLVEQFNQHGKSIVFYGDDTWTQLFPSP